MTVLTLPWTVPAVVAGVLACTVPAAAGSWTVTQAAAIAGPATLAQHGGLASTQAVNAIVPGPQGTVVQSTQTVDAGGSFTLLQGAGSGNRQAGNLVEAARMLEAVQMFTAGAVTIVNNGGVGNRQALNMALAQAGDGGGIGLLRQTASVESLAFSIAGGESNRQAGNLAVGSTAGSSITQTLTCSQTVTYADTFTLGGSDNLQAGNAVFGGATIAGVTQEFVANGVTVTFLPEVDGVANIKAANYLETASFP